MTGAEREVVTKEMMRGFNDTATAAGTKITGGQSVINEWPIIGGVANVVLPETEFIRPVHGKPGNVIVLTKPLGTQVAVNLAEWHRKGTKQPEKHEKERKWLDESLKLIDEETLNQAYGTACESMSRLNNNSAKLLHKYGSLGATDVTGFGILGHA